MREKLIEFIGSVEYGKGSLVGKNFQRGFIEKIADHLIANGVTIPKWIPVTERLPEESGKYLAYCGEYDGICILYHEALKTKSKWRTKWKEVTHWMPLPQPPKEENDG